MKRGGKWFTCRGHDAPLRTTRKIEERMRVATYVRDYSARQDESDFLSVHFRHFIEG